MRRLKNLAIFIAISAFGCGGAAADTIWIGNSMKDAIKVDGVKVQGSKDNALGYVTDQGMLTSKAFSRLPEINIDGETNFNAAEQAFANSDFDTAITAYQKLLQSSPRDWMQTRAAMRLIQAGKVRNRYDAQVQAYVTLLAKDPASAAVNRPAEPAEHSPYFDSALASIQKALSDARMDDAQKSSLLNLQLKINQIQGNNEAVAATLKQLVALGGGTDAMKATLKLADANVAYHDKQYQQAINDIAQNKGLFTDPSQQIDALYVLAEAKFAVDGEKSDPEILKDLALNFMRVVAFGNQLADRPHVAESLYQAGVIEEKLMEPAAAAQLYKQVVKGFPTSPMSAKADAALTRLGAAAGK